MLPGLAMVLGIWLVYYIEVTFNFNFNKYGVVPGELYGLRGILFSPFIHGGLSHLWGNTMPMIVLPFMLFYFYRSSAWIVLIFGGLTTGLLTWIIADSGRHIGASGIIYLIVFFLLVKGLKTRNVRLVATSFVVIFLYGSLVWYVLPVKAGMSWEGHLSGALVGIVCAIFLKVHTPVAHKFTWQEENFNPADDPFLRQFDEQGNFIELPDEEE